MEMNMRVEKAAHGRFDVQVFMLLLACLILFLFPPLIAQEQPKSRAEMWKEKRRQKLQKLKPYKAGKAENLLLKIEGNRFAERVKNGFWGFFPTFGGGVNVSEGTGAGILYEPTRHLEKVHFALRGGITTKNYQGYWVELGYTPDKFAVFGFSRHRKLPQEDFYGLGSSSSKEDRVHYRLDDTIIGAGVGIRYSTKILASLQLVYLKNDFGKGTDKRFPTPNEVFLPGSVAGIAEDSEFLISSIKMAFDTRDVQPPKKLAVMKALLQTPLEERGSNPTKGTLVSVHAVRYKDQIGAGRFDFNRIEFEFQQYIPFFHRHYVIAFRGFTSLVNKDDKNNGKVPFYVMRTLGGPNSLRGYEQFRFTDENILLFNTEYRWAAWSGMDVALFFDAGDVRPDRDNFELDRLKASYGFGFRLNTIRSVFARLEFAWSKEGKRIFLSFSNIF